MCVDDHATLDKVTGSSKAVHTMLVFYKSFISIWPCPFHGIFPVYFMFFPAQYAAHADRTTITTSNRCTYRATKNNLLLATSTSKVSWKVATKTKKKKEKEETEG